MITTYRVNCHEAAEYFWLCRINHEKPTVAGLVAYVRFSRHV